MSKIPLRTTLISDRSITYTCGLTEIKLYLFYRESEYRVYNNNNIKSRSKYFPFPFFKLSLLSDNSII